MLAWYNPDAPDVGKDFHDPLDIVGTVANIPTKQILKWP